MGEQPVSSGDVHDAAAATAPARTARHLPGFVEFLARQHLDAGEGADG